ncbi:MAG TPA: response regulator [Thermoanaerobaculia bacterium]|nr:response regulator [Thermoanaerobaculia bacterium]
MSDLRILIIEDEVSWLRVLSESLQKLGSHVKVDVAPSEGDALAMLSRSHYDLIVLDLVLRVDFNSSDTDESGMKLLSRIRQEGSNRDCGLIVLTGYATPELVRKVLSDFRVNDFVEKSLFSIDSFLDVARSALFDARLRSATSRSENRYYLTLTLGHELLLGTDLSGPDRSTGYRSERPVRFDASRLTRLGDQLSLYGQSAPSKAYRISKEIQDLLAKDQRFLGDLTAARALAGRFSDLWLQFSSSGSGLSFPLELLCDEGEHLALSHILTRRLLLASALGRKHEPFYRFMDDLRRRSAVLRILLLEDDNAEKQELRPSICNSMKEALQQLGILYEIHQVPVSETKFSAISGLLRYGNFHLLHVSGASWLGGKSGMRASDLQFLVRGTDMRLVFFDCELDSSTSPLGTFFESLARADVPVVLGYRWKLPASAAALAQDFYRALWRTLSPGEALLEARRLISIRDQEDCSWASPVLLEQTAP